MSDVKHTQGPWKLGSTGWHVEREDYGAQTSQGIISSDGVAICEVVSTEDDDTELDANARLIVAAPDMLEALKLAFFSIVGLELASAVEDSGWLWPESTPRHVSMVAETVRAAIAKATQP